MIVDHFLTTLHWARVPLREYCMYLVPIEPTTAVILFDNDFQKLSGQRFITLHAHLSAVIAKWYAESNVRAENKEPRTWRG